MSKFIAEKNGVGFVCEHFDLGRHNDFFLEEAVIADRRILVEYNGCHHSKVRRHENFKAAILDLGFKFVDVMHS